MFWPILGLIEGFLGPKWLFLAVFDPILPYIKVKRFLDILGSILNTPPYVYGHNFWTDAPNSKIQGILKTRDQWLSFKSKMKKIWKKWSTPPPMALNKKTMVLFHKKYVRK